MQNLCRTKGRLWMFISQMSLVAQVVNCGYSTYMKFKTSLLALVLTLSVFACTTYPAKETCAESGSIRTDKVPHPTQGFDISFRVYLPPCYDKQSNARFPTIYLITMPFERELRASDNTPMSLADRLIQANKMPPALIIVPNDTVAQGYHRALALDLVSYVDEKYKTTRDPRDRGVGGISHGAAIAARMAFQYPNLFGSLGVLSGGIDPSEKPVFNAWIASASAEHRPRVLIEIGNQDAIGGFTQNLLDVLDSQNVPYGLNIDPGGHSWEFWSTHMESYLLWFAEVWE
jgi:enterochelin esterase-like enzyme